MKRSLRLSLVLALTAAVAAQVASSGPRELLAGFVHLGDTNTPEWTEAPAEPTPGPLVLRFEGRANAAEHLLTWRHRNVHDRWGLELNGRELYVLPATASAELVEDFAAVPPGALVDGENVLRLACSTTTDDITIGEIRLHAESLAEHFDLRPLAVDVRDEHGAALPARVSILTAEGAPARVFGVEPSSAATRPGLVYVHGGARVELPGGEYRVIASRGTEWSRAETTVRLASDEAVSAATLTLRRELDTTGFIAADTHLHTLEISGHGDASLAERVLTLAGEGVELAIATDHNHNVDYRPHQRAAGLEAWYTPVVGNEVTTPIGHFNAFPLDVADEVPLHDSRDWSATVADMRAKGARCVILNHPRWPDVPRGPFGVEGVDDLTGARATSAPFDFDAIELVNATTEEHDPRALLRHWFALLDRGERIVGVGSSDSHTVGDPAGRGRTYVASASDDPADLDVDALATAIAEGRSSVSLGMILDVRHAGGSVMGHTLPATDGRVELLAVLQAPSWSRPERLEVFVNGRSVQSVEIHDWTAGERPYGAEVPLVLDLPDHDAYVVVVAWGGEVGAGWWPGHHDYTLAVTNPVYLDVSGDGLWSSPRDVARARLKLQPDGAGLAGLDDAAAVQFVELLEAHLHADVPRQLRLEVGPAAARSARVAELLERLADDD